MCGCEQVKDKESWHRYRGIPTCEEARAWVREKGRERYARRLGRPVKPLGRRLGWVAGTPILVPEIDPL
jgi:hypothetical protein